jgi:L-fuconolactonase
VALNLIDSHQHFWDPGVGDYPWMSGDYQPLARPRGPSDLSPLLEAAGVKGTVAIQARQKLAETRFLLECAAEAPWILGVVGWVDLTSPALAETIDEIRRGPEGRRLVGIRHLVHDEEDPEWLLRDDVLRGLGVLAEAGLVYDLLVRLRELPAAIEVARRLPELGFVLDHLAKPPIAAGEIEPWATAIGDLARLPNVTCKVSGMVTEADWRSWKPADLIPYVAKAVESFGPDRLMFGSDWPVCTLAATYSEVVDTTVAILTHLLGSDLERVLGGCAVATYGLDLDRVEAG